MLIVSVNSHKLQDIQAVCRLHLLQLMTNPEKFQHRLYPMPHLGKLLLFLCRADFHLLTLHHHQNTRFLVMIYNYDS